MKFLGNDRHGRPQHRHDGRPQRRSARGEPLPEVSGAKRPIAPGACFLPNWMR